MSIGFTIVAVSCEEEAVWVILTLYAWIKCKSSNFLTSGLSISTKKVYLPSGVYPI